MFVPPRPLPALAALFLALALGACGPKADDAQSLESLDRELAATNAGGNAQDPALTAALHDQIMVDPALAQQSNADAIRPPSRPDPGAVAMPVARKDTTDPATLKPAPAASATCPECKAKAGALTLGALAARQPNRSVADCAPGIGYSALWATRLPAGLPLYPDARVSEAAGADRDGCALRVVSFASGAAPARVIDWFYTRSTAAGYAAEHKADGTRQVLGGTHGNAAYILYVTPRGDGGSDVDLVSNGGV
ncbi:hypothetical protein [Sphingomonas sp. CROZ-RG-20F-R02-07]|uniref:hypothetical protein n=1 Tax=Sphingomonas sp. CROZ-RG-20F-R02-07 TaxID=2914832 RepID=UPI001F597995|nr:hypothetical protein [Sphingomonas sp. CROZ-RG-20F-R02-07]